MDDNKLSKKFREIQAKLHPDRYARKSDEEQALSIEWSSLVNVAYQTLHPPFKRATYLLKKHGINLPETNDAIDRAFLVNMMERNEEVVNRLTRKYTLISLLYFPSCLRSKMQKMWKQLKNFNDKLK